MKTEKNRKRTDSKMVVLNSIILIIALHISGLITPISKRLDKKAKLNQ